MHPQADAGQVTDMASQNHYLEKKNQYLHYQCVYSDIKGHLVSIPIL